jgi:hypothetical protein
MGICHLKSAALVLKRAGDENLGIGGGVIVLVVWE